MLISKAMALAVVVLTGAVGVGTGLAVARLSVSTTCISAGAPAQAANHPVDRFPLGTKPPITGGKGF